MSGPERGSDVDPVRERIVEVFTERARTLGPRSVVMAELANELGISTRTLYKHFRSKDELVTEMVTRLAEEVVEAQHARSERRLTPIERLRETALFWVETQVRFSAAFWREARVHHPDAMRVWAERMAPFWSAAREYLRPQLRDDVPRRLSVSILLANIRHASDPERCDRLGLSRQEAVVHAVELWARGALKRPALSLVPSPGERDGDGDG